MDFKAWLKTNGVLIGGIVLWGLIGFTGGVGGTLFYKKPHLITYKYSSQDCREVKDDKLSQEVKDDKLRQEVKDDKLSQECKEAKCKDKCTSETESIDKSES